ALSPGQIRPLLDRLGHLILKQAFSSEKSIHNEKWAPQKSHLRCVSERAQSSDSCSNSYRAPRSLRILPFHPSSSSVPALISEFQPEESTMLTCIARPKKLGDDSLSQPEVSDSTNTPASSNNKQQAAIKSLTFQLKDMALKASGAYRHCAPCTGPAIQSRLKGTGESDADSDRFRWSYRRTGSSSSTTPRTWGRRWRRGSKGSPAAKAPPTRQAVAELTRSCSSKSASPRSGWPRWSPEFSSRSSPCHVAGTISSAFGSEFRWGQGRGLLIPVKITPPDEKQANKGANGDNLSGGGPRLIDPTLSKGVARPIQSGLTREIFNKWQAQRWWAENYDRVMELYNVQRFNRQAFPLPTPPRSEDESSKMESAEASPVTPPLTRERLPRNLYRPTGMAMSYSSSDSLDHHPMQSRHYYDSGGINSTPKLSSISGTKTETSSMDASIRSSSSREADRSGELSISNASDLETEWVEQDEPGVYITIRALPGGKRELRRVRFSREKFGEMHARLWWEENRARIHEHVGARGASIEAQSQLINGNHIGP
ncbi:BREVIS RADIX-like 4, partial [Prunus dulcis]